MKHTYLVETCLLTHGLRSVKDEEVEKAWKNVPAAFAWIEDGDIKIGELDEFMHFRKRRVKPRANCKNLDEYLKDKKMAALTASGTMEVCRRLGISMAVSCGIGGFGNIPGEKICMDLPALAELPVDLVATSPKDMIDIAKTFSWLRENGVKILGYQSEYCTGYVFDSAHEKLDGTFYENSIFEKPGKKLLLNPIPVEKRCTDRKILNQAVKTAYEAAEKGEYFHPVANAEIDRLTDGVSSYIQLDSIVQNAILAGKLVR